MVNISVIYFAFRSECMCVLGPEEGNIISFSQPLQVCKTLQDQDQRKSLGRWNLLHNLLTQIKTTKFVENICYFWLYNCNTLLSMCTAVYVHWSICTFKSIWSTYGSFWGKVSLQKHGRIRLNAGCKCQITHELYKLCCVG